jgi:hypothetical protein
MREVHLKLLSKTDDFRKFDGMRIDKAQLTVSLELNSEKDVDDLIQHLKFIRPSFIYGRTITKP